MPPYDALESLPLRHADDIDPVALFEDVGFDRLPDRYLAVLLEFPKHAARRRLMFLQVAELGLGQLAVLHLPEGKLHRFIAVALFGLNHDDPARTGFDDGNRRQPRLVQHLRHAELLSEQPVCHNLISTSTPAARFSFMSESIVS